MNEETCPHCGADITSGANTGTKTHLTECTISHVSYCNNCFGIIKEDQFSDPIRNFCAECGEPLDLSNVVLCYDDNRSDKWFQVCIDCTGKTVISDVRRWPSNHVKGKYDLGVLISDTIKRKEDKNDIRGELPGELKARTYTKKG